MTRNLWLALEQALFEMCDFKAAQKICALKGLDTDLKQQRATLQSPVFEPES